MNKLLEMGGLPQAYIYLNEMDLENYLILKNNVIQHGFEEKDDSYYISDDYDSIIIKIQNKSFEMFMEEILENIEEYQTLIPSFCFVDPFGFSATPFNLFVKYMKNNNAEILLNFIYEETNRFIRHPNEKIREQIKNHLGLVNLDELIGSIENKDPKDRKKTIVETYTGNILAQTDAPYVSNFELRKSGRTKLILFHITKNIHGLSLMKETMWKHDETGTYTYDDRDNLIQLNFEEILANDKDHHIEVLSELIYKKFIGSLRVAYEDIESFVITDTIYPLTNFSKPAMKLLEDKNLVFNFVDRNRRRTYPSNCKMDFK